MTSTAAPTRADRVLAALQRASSDGDGWVCARTLAHHKVGGWRYSAAIWLLRRDGHRIDRRICTCDRCRYARDHTPAGHRPSRIYAWRLQP